MKPIEPKLISHAAAGDRQAFSVLYKQSAPYVYAVAMGIARNPDDAADITHDVFIKLHRNLKSFSFQSSFSTWLYRVTVNESLNHTSKRSRERFQRADFEQVTDILSTPDDTAPAAEQKETQGSVMALLDTLSPDHRTCIVLRELEGLNYAEMAEILQIPLNTVRTRLKRAREALLKCAGKEEVCYELQPR